MSSTATQAQAEQQTPALESQDDARSQEAWRQVSPGRYERSISGPEKFLKVMADFGEPYGTTNEVVTTIVDYRCSRGDIVDAFRHAWQHMHNDFPQMATPLIGNTRVYDVGEVKKRCLETFFVVDDKPIEDVFSDLGIMEWPALYVLPKAQKLMVAATHGVTDGRGELYFLDELFKRVAAISEGRLDAEVKWNEEDVLRRLAPSLNIITKPAPTQATIEVAQHELQDMGKYQDGIGLHHATSQRTGKARFQGIQFSEKESAGILAAIRKRGWTFTPVAHAAIATAINKYVGTMKPNNGIICVDLRRYCGEHATQPMTMYLGLPLRTVIDTSSFDKTVDAMVANYKTVQDDFASGEMAAIDDEFWKFMKESGQDPPPPERSIVDFSSLGVVDKFIQHSYGDVEIRRVSQQCRESMRMLFMYACSFRGRTRASISYNDLFHEMEEIQLFARLFKTELLCGLGVEEEIGPLEEPL